MITYNTPEDEDAQMSLGRVIKNNGFFKSQAQSKFILSGKYFDIWTKRYIHESTEFVERQKLVKNAFGITINEGQEILLVRAISIFANYGYKSRRKTEWAYVIDKEGVVEQHKLHFIYADLKHYGEVNVSATERLWRRTDHEIPNYKTVEECKAIDDAKRIAENANTTFIGEIKQRIEFVGTVKSIVSMGLKNFGYNNVIEGFRTIIITADGNTIVYWGKLANVIEGNCIKFKATIIGHDEYNFVKQTIVNRPKLIEVI